MDFVLCYKRKWRAQIHGILSHDCYYVGVGYFSKIIWHASFSFALRLSENFLISIAAFISYFSRYTISSFARWIEATRWISLGRKLCNEQAVKLYPTWHQHHFWCAQVSYDLLISFDLLKSLFEHLHHIATYAIYIWE